MILLWNLVVFGFFMVISFFLLVRVTIDALFFQPVKLLACESWKMCWSVCLVLLTLSRSSLASAWSFSVLYFLSFLRAHLRALFCSVCSFFLFDCRADVMYMLPYSMIGRIIFLYINNAALSFSRCLNLLSWYSLAVVLLMIDVACLLKLSCSSNQTSR